MTERYLPVPVWNGAIGSWEPVDFRQGQRVVVWPEGFDHTTLPAPEYREGEHVQFVRDETCARDGVVRRVLLHGGVYSSAEGQDRAIQRWYLDSENITYIVTARGHDHSIKVWNILGRFVSLAHISRILPLQN